MEESKKRNGRWQHLVDQCLEVYSKIKNSKERQKKLELIEESKRIYEMEPKILNFPWEGAYNLVQPFLSIALDNLEPRIVSAFVGKEPYVQFDMVGVSEPDEAAKFLEAWFQDELKETVKVERFVSNLVHKLLLEGTVFPVVSYKEESTRREDFSFNESGQIEIDEDGNPLIVEREETIFQGGTIDFCEFEDIYIPDKGEDWEKIDIVRKIRPTYSELKKWEKEQAGFRNIGKWLLKEEELDEDSGKEVIECLEYHVNYVYQRENQTREEIENWEQTRLIALIALDSKTLIRLIQLTDLNLSNEHLIKRVRLFPEFGKSYGKSLYEKMRSIQDGASDTFNLLMNSAYLILLPWFFYSDKAGLEEEVEIVPGRGIRVDDPSSIQFPNIRFNLAAFLKIYDIWSSLWERLSSIGDLQVGRPSTKARTATETMAVIQEGNIKHNYQSTVLKEEFVSILRGIFDLYYRWMPFDKTFFYRGQEVLIPRQTMRRGLKFRLTGSTELSNRILELQKNEQLYNMLRPDPLINPERLLKNLIASFKPEDSPEDYIDPALSQAIQQFLLAREQAQAQGQQAQVAGGQAPPGGEPQGPASNPPIGGGMPQ